jgi:dienelactone hydrolase
VTLPFWRHRLIVVSVTIGIILAIAGLISACAGQRHLQRHADKSSSRESRAKPLIGTLGSYSVAERRITFLEPTHIGPDGQHLGQRVLVTLIRYPLAERPVNMRRPAHGPFPMLMFAPGFMQCGGPYSRLLHAWASAGYVVAVVNFPHTNCHVGATADEADLLNQPGDVSYVISRLLALSAQQHGLLSGMLNHSEIAATGQSDGGDTVAALAASACCADHRLVAVAVLSGAEWQPMPGRYFAHGSPPMLFVQGSADVINPPWTSLQLYRADTRRHARYYLDLFGANHTIPYIGTNPVERLVARVTLAFLDRYVLGYASGITAMARDGNVRRMAALVDGGQPPP